MQVEEDEEDEGGVKACDRNGEWCGEGTCGFGFRVDGLWMET